MFKHIVNFNTWFDGLPGDKRFGLFMAAMITAIFPMQLGFKFGYPIIGLLGLTWFSVITFVGAIRALGIQRHKLLHAIVSITMMLMLLAIVLKFAIDTVYGNSV
jgi:hypothetical protein